MGIIDIDWRDTINKAEQLESLAGDLQRVIDNELQRLQDAAGNRWQGAAAELYRKKARTFVQQMQSEQKELRNLALSLKKTAQVYRDLEKLGNTIFGV